MRSVCQICQFEPFDQRCLYLTFGRPNDAPRPMFGFLTGRRLILVGCGGLGARIRLGTILGAGGRGIAIRGAGAAIRYL